MFCGNVFAVCAGTVKTCFLTVLFLLLPDGLKRDDHFFFNPGILASLSFFAILIGRCFIRTLFFSFLRIFLKKTDIQNYIELIYLLFTI